MSCDPIWTVWCDVRGDGCPQWCHQTGATSREARQYAIAVGWKRQGGLDICPTCQKGRRTP